MRILLAGGVKTGNIVAGVSKRFATGGIDFITLEKIEEIESLYSQGEYFDKAIIIEQSWTHDGTLTNEDTQRQLINAFAEMEKRREKENISYVFLVTSQEIGTRVYEECFSIIDKSVIIVKKPPYSAKFFSDLIILEARDFPEEIVYKHQKTEIADEAMDLGFDSPEYEVNTNGSFDEDFGDFSHDNFGNVGVDTGVQDVLPKREEVEEIEIDESLYEEPKPVAPAAAASIVAGATGFGREKFNQPMPSFDQDDIGVDEESAIDDTLYEEDESQKFTRVSTRGVKPDVKVDNKQLASLLAVFASRGNSIVVTGCGGCGTSTIAYNLANVVSNIGYTALLVDLDTAHRAQSYISRDNYMCIDPESTGLLAAINSTSEISNYIGIPKPQLHLLGVGMGSDPINLEKRVQPAKIARFANMVKANHNFVIYDIPFELATTVFSDILYLADNIVIPVDFSNWGITKTLLSICNLENEEVTERIFDRAQLLFNRVKKLDKVMGKKIKNVREITKVMDKKVFEIVGEDPGFYFRSMPICGMIEEDTSHERCWFESTQYSDTKKGHQLYVQLLSDILTVHTPN